MKTVTVRLTGHVEVFLLEHPNGVMDAERISAYDYMTDLEDDGLTCKDMTEVAFLKEIDELGYSFDVFNLDDDEDNREWTAIEKKGKYIKSKDYIATKLHMEVPYIVQHSDSTFADFEYAIELEDDEEFDPMKLQLVKSNYEASWLPYGIVTNYIMYDNKLILNQLEKCFDIYAESGCFLYDDFNTCKYIF